MRRFTKERFSWLFKNFMTLKDFLDFSGDVQALVIYMNYNLRLVIILALHTNSTLLLLILNARIYPWASSKGGAHGHGSQSDDSTYLARTWKICAVVFNSPLTSRLCSQLQELQELPTSPLRMCSSSKSINFYLPGLLDRELNPGPRVTMPMLFTTELSTHTLQFNFLVEEIPLENLRI